LGLASKIAFCPLSPFLPPADQNLNVCSCSEAEKKPDSSHGPCPSNFHLSERAAASVTGIKIFSRRRLSFDTAATHALLFSIASALSSLFSCAALQSRYVLPTLLLPRRHASVLDLPSIVFLTLLNHLLTDGAVFTCCTPLIPQTISLPLLHVSPNNSLTEVAVIVLRFDLAPSYPSSRTDHLFYTIITYIKRDIILVVYSLIIHLSTGVCCHITP